MQTAHVAGATALATHLVRDLVNEPASDLYPATFVERVHSLAEGLPVEVDVLDEERLAAEYRWATFTNPTVKARLPGSWTSIEIETALRREADALALAASIGALFGLRPDGSPRVQWKVTVERAVAQQAELGDTIAVDDPSQGISGRFLLVGEQLLRPRRDQVVWTLWG